MRAFLDLLITGCFTFTTAAIAEPRTFAGADAETFIQALSQGGFATDAGEFKVKRLICTHLIPSHVHGQPPTSCDLTYVDANAAVTTMQLNPDAADAVYNELSQPWAFGARGFGPELITGAQDIVCSSVEGNSSCVLHRLEQRRRPHGFAAE